MTGQSPVRICRWCGVVQILVKQMHAACTTIQTAVRGHIIGPMRVNQRRIYTVSTIMEQLDLLASECLHEGTYAICVY